AALGELALRYFTGHGPASVPDLAWWSGLPLTPVRAAVARVRDRLDALEVDGVEYLMRPGLEPLADRVHALPGFDEYLLGYADRA
ncbi:DNA glycosylase AlkZ-like family protein, partial [Schumannella sp. 10F1B-5-1]|uniref:DNA glycosylase AlkZ-like family protein n=1 Tax=Schumannella sp. 10F1B-5-1 TaxID=2590780 RepID=UPI001130F57A